MTSSLSSSGSLKSHSSDDSLLLDPFLASAKSAQTSSSALLPNAPGQDPSVPSQPPPSSPSSSSSSLPASISTFVGSFSLPPVASLSCLAFHKYCRVPYPVRVCPPDEGDGLALSQGSLSGLGRGERGWDEETFSLIQYISCPMGEYKLVKKSVLLPFDHDDEGEGGGWSKALVDSWGKSYGKGENARSKFRRDRAFACRILEAARSMPVAEGEKLHYAPSLPSQLAVLPSLT
jgi:hypothetical protein